MSEAKERTPTMAQIARQFERAKFASLASKPGMAPDKEEQAARELAMLRLADEAVRLSAAAEMPLPGEIATYITGRFAYLLARHQVPGWADLPRKGRHLDPAQLALIQRAVMFVTAGLDTGLLGRFVGMPLAWLEEIRQETSDIEEHSFSASRIDPAEADDPLVVRFEQLAEKAKQERRTAKARTWMLRRHRLDAKPLERARLMAEVAREFGCSTSALKNWLRNHPCDLATAPGSSAIERAINIRMGLEAGGKEYRKMRELDYRRTVSEL